MDITECNITHSKGRQLNLVMLLHIPLQHKIEDQLQPSLIEYKRQIINNIPKVPKRH